MSDTPHKLTDEFPEYRALISHLKQVDGHFARIADDYTEINRQIHLAETDIEPTSDLHITELRKDRMRLKDEIFGILARHEPEAEKLA